MHTAFAASLAVQPLYLSLFSASKLPSAGSAIAIDASDVALFTNDLKCLAPVIKLGRNAKRKILLNIILSVVTKVRVAAQLADL